MPSFRSLVIPVVILVIFVGAGFAMYQVADVGQRDAARGGGTDVINESHVQQVDMWKYTDNSFNDDWAGADDNVTVYNDSDFELEEGTDYEWNETDGSIFFYNTANTNDGSGFNLTYTYFSNTHEVNLLSAPIEVIVEGTGHLAYVGAGFALIVFLIGFAAIAAKTIGKDRKRTRR